MKKNLFIRLIFLLPLTFSAQDCSELITKVKNIDYGSTYTSYNSDAISRISFHEVVVDYSTKYFAIVSFKNKNSYLTNEYIYLVSSNTKFNYSLNYNQSAGKAFWKYIQPYNKNLNCGPDL